VTPDLAITLVKYAAMFLVFLNVAPIMNWVERRACAYIQDRPGPNRVGPFGLFQPLADVAKFMFKEDVTPAAADKVLYLMAPALALLPAFTTFVVIPFGPDITVAGEAVRLVVANVDTGVLLFLALSSLSVYSLVMAGYASNNKFSLLGSVRASAQLISYELALTLSVLAVLLPVGSFHLGDVVAYQRGHLWNFIPQILGFLVFLIAAFAETNRLPFDLPEAESELVAGFHTEYGSMRFALFFMAEYTNMAALSALGVTLYFGGWSLPWIEYPHNLLGGILGLATLVAKIAICMAIFVWVRWTFPRFRYDQLMRLGWKVLLPIAILNLILVAAMTLAGWL
jgi:NADH-quinone oxidoreductase subunit H